MSSLYDELEKIKMSEPPSCIKNQIKAYIEASIWFDKLVDTGITKKREPLVERPIKTEHSNFSPIIYHKE